MFKIFNNQNRCQMEGICLFIARSRGRFRSRGKMSNREGTQGSWDIYPIWGFPGLVQPELVI